ncbi:MAG: hypothetical protein [Caudoviricetes sp.]|nr:MAG: hypothetical protein [Caudoviricetes sp.]
MEFKGTKGKFHYHESSYRHFVSDDNGKDICTMSEEHHVYLAGYNGLLLSKAPEMLEMLKNIKYRLNSEDKWSVEQLIKEATEL